MTTPLIAGIIGLALVDAFNPATIVAVVLILLSTLRHPVACALAFVAGAYTAVLVLGLAVFTGAGAAADVVSDGLLWLRRIAFGIAALGLLIAALRRLRPRVASAVALPGWFSPWTALPLGVVVTGADLPNAFPYLIAIERLVAADVALPEGLVVLASYAVIYCLPCLLLLAVGTFWGERVNRRLARLHDRFGRQRPVPRSVPVAICLAILAVGLGAVAVTA